MSVCEEDEPEKKSCKNTCQFYPSSLAMLNVCLGKEANTDTLEEIRKAIANKKTIDRKHAHSVFVGPTGSGKTSFMA